MPSSSSRTSSRLTLYDDETGPAKSLGGRSIPNTLMFDESFGGYAGLLENVLDAVRGLLAARRARRATAPRRSALIEAIRRSIDASAGSRRLSSEGLVRMKIRKLETFLANAGLAQLPVRPADDRHAA